MQQRAGFSSKLANGVDLGDMSIEARIKVDVFIETHRSNFNASVYSAANDTTGDSD